MLRAEYYLEPTDLDEMIFAKLIPANHYLRRLNAAIDFEPLRALVADCYAAGMGAPAEDPVRRIKYSIRGALLWAGCSSVTSTNARKRP